MGDKLILSSRRTSKKRLRKKKTLPLTKKKSQSKGK